MTQRVMDALHSFARARAGATAIEYAMIGAGISIVIVGAVTGIGESLIGMFEDVAPAFAGIGG